MPDDIRGVTCSLPSMAIGQLLQFLSELEDTFFIPWCDRIQRREEILPKSFRDKVVTASDLRQLAGCSIFELVLHLYPADMPITAIDTYADFLNSHCLCCLIYYDCGILDLYIKEAVFREKILKKLTELNAEELTLLTWENDGRTVMYP